MRAAEAILEAVRLEPAITVVTELVAKAGLSQEVAGVGDSSAATSSFTKEPGIDEAATEDDVSIGGTREERLVEAVEAPTTSGADTTMADLEKKGPWRLLSRKWL